MRVVLCVGKRSAVIHARIDNNYLVTAMVTAFHTKFVWTEIYHKTNPAGNVLFSFW